MESDHPISKHYELYNWGIKDIQSSDHVITDVSLATQQRKKRVKIENIICCAWVRTCVLFLIYFVAAKTLEKKNVDCVYVGCHVNNFSPAEKVIGL